MRSYVHFATGHNYTYCITVPWISTSDMFISRQVIDLVTESVDYQLPTNHISTACVVIYLILLYLMYDTISVVSVSLLHADLQHTQHYRAETNIRRAHFELTIHKSV